MTKNTYSKNLNEGCLVYKLKNNKVIRCPKGKIPYGVWNNRKEWCFEDENAIFHTYDLPSGIIKSGFIKVQIKV